MAQRTGQPEAALRAAAHMMTEVPSAPPPEDRVRLERTIIPDVLYAAESIPSHETMMQLQAERAAQPQPFARVYKGLDWAVIADDSIFPRLRMSVRGGSSVVRGHGHIDLLSIKCRVNNEMMIEDQKGDVFRVNFTGRGPDLYARSAASKSTLFVDGLPIRNGSEVSSTDTVAGDGIIGVRLDASKAFLPRSRGFIGRLVLLVDSQYWLVIDTAPGRLMESRFHTYADTEIGDDWAVLQKGDEQLAMRFASLSAGQVQQSRGMPAVPVAQTRIIRWMSRDTPDGSLHVTAMNPGTENLAVALRKDEEGFSIHITGKDTNRTILLTHRLELRQ